MERIEIKTLIDPAIPAASNMVHKTDAIENISIETPKIEVGSL